MDEFLELPILGEASDEALPIVGELSDRIPADVPLQFTAAGETLEDGMLESSICCLDVSPMCVGKSSASVPLEGTASNSSVNTMTLPVVGEGEKISPFSDMDRGVEGSQFLGTYVANAIVQDADTSSASDFGLPVVGEASGDFAASQSASPRSPHDDLQDSNALVSSVEIPASLLDGEHLRITLYMTR